MPTYMLFLSLKEIMNTFVARNMTSRVARCIFGGTFSTFSLGGSFLLDKPFDEKTEFCIFVPLT